jgi:predicted TIM-barrel fold metal-dependent hydrolase
VSAVEARQHESRDIAARITLVDCDVHPYFSGGVRDLCDYLPVPWQKRLGLDQPERAGSKPHGVPGFTLPANFLYFDEDATFRLDASRAGEMPGSDAEFVAEQLLDAYGVDRAILISGNMLGLGALPEPDSASVIASAYNDWMIERWLRVDSRYRGSLVIAPQDPVQAASEINRVGDVPGLVSIFVPLLNIAMGRRHYDPIYEAAERHGLPVQVHPSGTESVFVTAPPLAQTPAYKIEYRTMFHQAHQANLISMICHGVFERYPNLIFVITEAGFAWLPDLIWRLDASWKALREEVPWVKRAPSEYVKDNVRFTTQPFPEGPASEYVSWLCAMVNGANTLMFSSDYPHFDFDDPKRALKTLPADLRESVFSKTAISVFGDRLL